MIAREDHRLGAKPLGNGDGPTAGQLCLGLLAGGPVGRLKMTATRDGATIEADNV